MAALLYAFSFGVNIEYIKCTKLLRWTFIQFIWTMHKFSCICLNQKHIQSIHSASITCIAAQLAEEENNWRFLETFDFQILIIVTTK